MNLLHKQFKLRNKLVLFYLPVFIIPITVLGVYLSIALNRNSIDQSLQIYHQSTNLLQQSIMSELSDYYSIGIDIAQDSNVVEYLGIEGSSDIELYNFYVQRIGELIDKAKYQQDNIQLRIYTSNTNLKFSGIFVRDASQFEEKKKQAAAYTSSACWQGISEQKVWIKNQLLSRKYLTFLMPIMNYQRSLEPIGVLELKMDISRLQELIDTQNISDNIVLLTDSSGRFILSNITADDTLLEIAKTEKQNDESEHYVTYLEERYLATISNVTNAQIGVGGWTLCNLIPLDYVNRNRNSIVGASITVCAGCLLVVIPLLYLFAKTITRRLEYLANHMDDIRHGEYDISILVPGNDEVSALGNCFNQMLQELDLLQKQAMEAKLEKEKLRTAQKDAQLLALQRQINPHYLFNTLEGFRMSLVLKGDQETAELIRIFAESFREMIDGRDRTIAISNELAFVQKYFAIQDFRYEGKLCLQIKCAPHLPDYMIPKFLLQPLIENSIYHGLEMKEDGGTIRVYLYQRENSLCIAVTDNGVGMNRIELEALCKSIDDEENGRNTAMRNIVCRLRLIYREKTTFRVLSEPGKGTRVFLTLPVDQLEVNPDVFGDDR